MLALAKPARLVGWAFLLALLVNSARPAAALDDFGVAPDKRVAKALGELAETCFECGDKAKEKGLYTSARSFFDHALRYDPEHKQTRKVMGFKKKKGAWVLEEDMVPLTDKVLQSRRAELETKLYNETREIRGKAADNLFKLVADKELAAGQRLLALYHLLRIYPEHRDGRNAARAAPDVMWFKHALDDESETLRQKRVGQAAESEAITEPTLYETACGFSMAKRRTPWFVLHLDIGASSEPWAASLARFAEASRSHVLELTGRQPTTAPKEDKDKLHYTAFNTPPHFETFVEKCSGIADPAHRAEIAKNSGGSPTYKPYGSVWLYTDTDNDYGLRDGISHDIAIKEIFRATGDGAYWLAQGLGYLSSTHMNGSTQARFYGVKQSGVINTGGKEALPGLGECSAGWRLLVALMAAGGKAPKPSEVAALRVNDFNNEHMALCFCWADYLCNKQNQKFRGFLDSAYKERAARIKDKKPGETPAEVLSRLFRELGVDEAGFIDGFKTWALENYVQLPQ